MSRGVQLLVGSVCVAALTALAGCGHYFYSGEREAWRHDAEVACVNSGAVKESPERVRISAISGPGICGADFPIRVSALGESGPLSYDDEPLRPPGAIADEKMPQHWPVVQSNALPPPQPVPQQYDPAPYRAPQMAPLQAHPPQPGPPLSLYAPGIPDPEEDDAAFEPTPPQPYGRTPAARPGAPSVAASPPAAYPPPTYTPRARPGPPGVEEHVPLGWPRSPTVTGSMGPVEVRPAATLACPIVSALDQWIVTAVQPAAMRWFHQPIVEIKQISAYSCRGMNGNPNEHISEHAFGNALDIAEFGLADGHKISVQFGWHGAPEEQGFLHDVQLAACEEFSTVLAPGANVYHYNHIHVDLMRRSSGRRICQPAAIPGEVVAERARARYASQHYSDPSTTGSISKRIKRVLGYSGEDDDSLPLAVPGED
jgi:Extensin-like protein C-terminus